MALPDSDKAAIHELLARYCHNADYNPPAHMREMFTADGVFEVPAMNLHFTGIDAIVGFFTASREADSSARHVISNVVVEGAGDQATSSAYLQVLGLKDGQATPLAFGRYIDRLSRGADGRWRLAHRRVEIG
jgi:ketosteroid isomerase-like protein